MRWLFLAVWFTVTAYFLFAGQEVYDQARGLVLGAGGVILAVIYNQFRISRIRKAGGFIEP